MFAAKHDGEQLDQVFHKVHGVNKARHLNTRKILNTKPFFLQTKTCQLKQKCDIAGKVSRPVMLEGV